jgi:hypothetical protein
VVVPPSSVLAFFHAAPAVSQLDIYIDDTKLNATFDFKTYSGYLQVTPVGKKRVRFTPTGGTTAVIDTTVTFVDKKAYSLIIASKASGAARAVFTEDTGTLVSNQNTMIRFVHMSPDTPAVDVKFTDVNKTLCTGQSYLGASTYTEFESRGYTAEIRRSSDQVLLLTVALPIPSGGAFQSIYLLGYTKPPAGNLNTLSYKIAN